MKYLPSSVNATVNMLVPRLLYANQISSRLRLKLNQPSGACKSSNRQLEPAAQRIFTAIQRASHRSWQWPLLALTLTSGCTHSNPPPPVAAPEPANRYAFEELAGPAAIERHYENGEGGRAFSILESLGGGCGVFDFDLDGRWDVWLPGGGHLDGALETITGLPSALYRYQTTDAKFVDVSRPSRIENQRNYTHGCSIADIDSDGFPDVVVTGYGGLQCFRNLGDGTFEECAAAMGLTDQLWSSSSAFADFDSDGDVDLYITHYVDWSWQNNPKCRSAPPDALEDVCTPSRFNGLTDTLYINSGDGSFVDASQTAGLVAEGKGLGVILSDLDHDSDVDIYVANDTTSNFLYLNDGNANFDEVGLVSGTSLDHRGTPNGSMGLALLDYDADQLPDIWVTNFENETFCMYRNTRDGNFQCVTESTGITALGSLYVGFGTCAVDIELDGDEDVVVSNGHVQQHAGSSSIAQHALLLLNDAHGHLSQQEFSSGYFSDKHRGRSVVAADFNQDGLLDLLFQHVNSPPALLINQCDRVGNWINLQLVGTTSNRDAIGARVELHAGEATMLRHVVGGGGYLSQAPYSLHWGIPSDTAVSATVHWPNGQTQQLDNLAINQSHIIVQP